LDSQLSLKVQEFADIASDIPRIFAGIEADERNLHYAGGPIYARERNH
jgi:hypothetical protein